MFSSTNIVDLPRFAKVPIGDINSLGGRGDDDAGGTFITGRFRSTWCASMGIPAMRLSTFMGRRVELIFARTMIEVLLMSEVSPFA